MAVFWTPVVRLMSASSPWTVLLFVKQASWQVAFAADDSPKQASEMRRNASPTRDLFTFLNWRVVVFIMRGGSQKPCRSVEHITERLTASRATGSVFDARHPRHCRSIAKGPLTEAAFTSVSPLPVGACRVPRSRDSRWWSNLLRQVPCRWASTPPFEHRERWRSC